MAFTRIDGDVYLVDAEGGELPKTTNALALYMSSGEWYFCNGDDYVPAFSESSDKDALQAALTRSVLSRGLDLDDLFLARYLSGEEQPTVASITVAGLGNEDPTTVTFTEEGTFNWNFGNVRDEHGNIFVKIPTMWRKVNTVTDGQITSFTISDKKIDNTYEPYPCFLDGNGNVLPYVLIGKYCCSSTSIANSVNADPVTQNLQMGRTNARALGTGYQLYDWQMQKLFVDLALCHKKSVNFNSGQTIQSYLGIYHLNESIWVDGFYVNNGTWYYALNPADYVSDPNSHPPTGYTAAGYTCPITNGYEVKALGYDSNAPFFNQPSDAVSNSLWDTYYCDTLYYRGDSHPVFSQVGSKVHYEDATHGLWNTNGVNSWSSYWNVRLCYRPISA